MNAVPDVFLSYSRRDAEAAGRLRLQLVQAGFRVFQDIERIRPSDEWLRELQEALAACRIFVVLVGEEGVRRWVGAEVDVAQERYIDADGRADQIMLLPVLLDGREPRDLPPLLRRIQAARWAGEPPLAEPDLERLRAHRTEPAAVPFDAARGPFVGLKAFDVEDELLFFGRQREALEALGRFKVDHREQVRWLEISGGSGSGKSSLMQAGLLPLVDRDYGLLWRRTEYDAWRRIGPLKPGATPVDALAEYLAGAFDEETTDVRERLERGDERVLAEWLRTRRQRLKKARPNEHHAFMLAIDQFEELFTFADAGQRARFDALLAAALADPCCPLFVVSTVRNDFLDRFAALLPRLVEVRNRGVYATYEMPRMSDAGLRDVIRGPARLAGLDVESVVELIVDDASDEPGMLPLVENALTWLYADHGRRDGKLQGERFRDAGRLAGILTHTADELLGTLDEEQDKALDLLVALVRVYEGQRHTRRRLSLDAAVAAAGGGAAGRDIVDRLAGRRALAGPAETLRLVVVGADGTVSLIHELLAQSRLDESGVPTPYWLPLWQRIEAKRDDAVREEILRLRIVRAARVWEQAGRSEDARWPEETCQAAIREARDAGFNVRNVLHDDSARAFFGPSERDEIVEVLQRGEDDDAAMGSGFYGTFWHLPLGHEARARLGDRLAVGGDTRPGVGLRDDGVPDIEWCDIEGGEITIEGRTVAVAPFRMAKYPVTILQFRAFVEACNRDGRWYLDGFRIDKLKKPPHHSGRHENYPADSVSCYDGAAFCHWVSGRLREELGAEVRLPTEFEWQLAATGGNPDNTYPWDRDWDPERQPWRANTKESGLGRATAVGLYPAGASRAGIDDLAGTVWEWSSSVHKDGSTGDTSDPSLRVVRGGSWSDGRGFAPCAGRCSFDPNFRVNFIGFRVVCSSPIVIADP